MKTASWAVALIVAALWPARLAGPLDGAPLDSALEAVVLGLALPAVIWFHPDFLRTTPARVLIVALLAWKSLTAVATVQDGWCVRFTSPVPLFLEDTRVPHSWDVRADWRSAVPTCSAVMTHGYADIEHFPAWFYNLPPPLLDEPARATDRPPHTTTRLDVTGYLAVDDAGQLTVAVDEGVRLRASIDGAPVDDTAGGVRVEPGTHRIDITGELTGSRWRLMPAWNGRPLWNAVSATMSPPQSLDLALRPWGRWVTVALIAGIGATALASVIRFAGTTLAAAAGAASVTVAAALSGHASAMRVTPLLLMYAAWIPLPRRLRNLHGMVWLVGMPFLALFAVLGIPQAGLFTWYSSGDDWWMFQRYAYRIYLQGYWLEGGELTFWFQPFYRWVIGALHMVFGDSSVGELFWDAACTLVGAMFAFQCTRVMAGYRWGMAAAVATLALMTMGPAWYLFGRGLSEITSTGFLYGAALFAWRGRRRRAWIIVAGVLAVLAFYTRLNTLPMAVALIAFAWPPRFAVSAVFTPAIAYQSLSRPVAAGMIVVVALGVLLFTARTYYYTGVFSLFKGTQSAHLSVWQPPDGGGSIAGNVAGSVLMVLTMSDPPRADPRALPIVIGVLAAIGGVAGAGRLRYLPVGPVALCLAGMAGTLVTRGSAYPGRFSVPILPVAVALFVITLALLVDAVKPSRCGRPTSPPS